MTNDTVMPVMPAGFCGELEALYEDATTERERDAIRRCMDMMS